jgi:hypothetical protein
MAREWTSRPPGTRAVRVDVREDYHAKLRVLAAEAGVAMSAYVRGLAEAAVRARYPEMAEEPRAEAEEPAPAAEPKKRGRPRKTPATVAEDATGSKRKGTK